MTFLLIGEYHRDTSTFAHDLDISTYVYRWGVIICGVIGYLILSDHGRVEVKVFENFEIFTSFYYINYKEFNQYRIFSFRMTDFFYFCPKFRTAKISDPLISNIRFWTKVEKKISHSKWESTVLINFGRFKFWTTRPCLKLKCPKVLVINACTEISK